jgi:hypothetical protein
VVDPEEKNWDELFADGIIPVQNTNLRAELNLRNMPFEIFQNLMISRRIKLVVFLSSVEW